MTDGKPRVLIIAGMHRSGTSAAAALLQSAGLHLGDRLLGPSPSNLRGHFENLDFVEFHQRRLKALGLSPAGWTLNGPLRFDEVAAGEALRLASINATTPAWGFKDPRTVLFLRAWAALLPQAAFLFVHRAPWEVADSLYRRSAEHDAVFRHDPAYAVDVWAHYNAEILSFDTEHSARSLIVSARSLGDHPQTLLTTLNQRFELGLKTPAHAMFEESLLKLPPDPATRPGMLSRYRSDLLPLYQALLKRSWLPLPPAEAAWLETQAVPLDPKAPFRDWIGVRLAEKKVATLISETDALRSRLDHAEGELERTRSSLGEMLTETAHPLAQARAEAERAQAEAERVRLEAERAETELERARAEGARLRAELAALREVAADRERMRTALQVALREAAKERDRAQTDLTTTRAELQRTEYYLAETLHNATTERARLQSELAEARGRLRELEHERLRDMLRRVSRRFWGRFLDAFHDRVGRPRAYLDRRRQQRMRKLADREAQRRQRTALTAPTFWKGIESALREHEARETEPCEVSILTPTYNTNLFGFRETVESVLRQTTTGWEWCLVDDGSSDRELHTVLEGLTRRVPRIRVLLAEHGGIGAATNRALAMAGAPRVCFLDHDDTLTPDAVATVREALNEEWDVAYSDEDKLDASGRLTEAPFHKPAWSPEYLRGVMYVGHLLAVRRELVRRVGGVRSEFDGVQDFELMLRLTEVGARVRHIPRILYHWRRSPGSVAESLGAKPGIAELQRAAVAAHLARLGLPARAEPQGEHHRIAVLPGPRQTTPQVSLIIPTKDAPGFLRRCLASIFATSTYPNFEVLLMDNETRDPDAVRIMSNFPVRRINLPGPFNYSRANNEGSRQAQGAYLLFLNNDTEILTHDWIEHLLYYAEQNDVGAVGGLLLFPDRTVQHAGIVLGFRGTADHVMRGFPAEADGYAGSLSCAREVSAVTGACMMVRKALFEEVGGMNEHYATHYQDVDLCLTLLDRGRRNIFTPRAGLFHFESATRSSRYDLVDRVLLLDRWQDRIEAGDPFFNPHFDLSRTDYSLRA
ncbi:MAG TPA: glycosyltransferase [Vicinamibacteria bacterium]|nr:glycosyltransferase [Vicinamibacteria bacterium]